MNLCASYKHCTPEQEKSLLDLFNQVSLRKSIEHFAACSSDLHHWDTVFISSAATEQFDPGDAYTYVFFLGNYTYIEASECTVQYTKTGLDDFIFQVKSVLFDLSMEE